jgi:hypothetical protein
MKLLLISSIYNKSQKNFEQKFILINKFRFYHTFVCSNKKILSYFFTRGDRLARILFNILCSNKRYTSINKNKFIFINFKSIFDNFKFDSGECVISVINFLRGKSIASINNTLHYKINGHYIKLSEKIIIKNFFFYLKSGGLVINAGQIVYKSKEGNFIGYFDFESFYPSILTNLGILPKFISDFYSYILNLRLEAKNKGNFIVSDSLKLLINSFSGSLAMGGNTFKLKNISWYHKMITFGQIYLLRLIDFVINEGCSILGGKTDGIYVLSKSNNILDNILKKWNIMNSNIRIDLTYIKFISIYNNRYIHLDYKNNLKVDGTKSSKSSIFQYNHNRLLPYCINILLKNYLTKGKFMIDSKLLKKEDLIN